ncbi:family 65 glycosyl hydrolase domain-containing protein [Bacillus subtilis]
MINQRLFEIDEWKIKTNTFNKEHTRLLESLTSLANGYMGVRGNFEEGYSGDSHQGTYIAGVWFPDKTRVGWWKNGYPEYFGKVINAMNFMGIGLYVDGEKIDLHQNPIESFEVELNMKEGILRRSAVVRIQDKSVRISSERFLSLAVKELCAIHSKAKELLADVVEYGYEKAKRRHTDRWKERWAKADIEIKGDEELQQGIRYNIFQLFSTYYGGDARLNIGPKGFTGEKYGGAAYWDTEAYAVPMYLATAEPEVTKNLLLYRYHQLEAAKRNAAKLGMKGALYPMVTFTGDECHNEWEITFEEIHRNGAICYAIYNYINYTGDRNYMEEYGIDVLVAVSRFWADRVHFSKRKNKYMIHGVTGPNEYENNVNNNWYTNVIAAWTLEYTLQSLESISAEKRRLLDVLEEELKVWREIIQHMYYPFSEELQIFVQHDTFLDKDLQTVDELDPAERPLYQNWSWDKILRSNFIKQADVLQGIYLFNDRFTMEEKRRNFEFYEPMTVHESSLSPSVHAILAAELKLEKKALELYKRTARLDLDNYNHDTEEGLHITSMTGSWLAIVHGFAGMRTANETLSFAPFLPKEWDEYSFNINYRNRLINVTVNEKRVIFELVKGEPLHMNVYEEPVVLKGRCERRTPNE